MNIERLVMRSTVVVALLCLVGVAKAQAATRATPCDPATPNNALCLTWAAPTTNTDGTPTVLALTYRVEMKAGSGSYSNAVANLTATQYYAKNLAPGTYTFRVYANCSAAGCVESPASNAAAKDATPIPIQPNAPVIIIAATIRANGPPTYRIIQSVTLKPNEVVFAAPASMKPLFASR